MGGSEERNGAFSAVLHSKLLACHDTLTVAAISEINTVQNVSQIAVCVNDWISFVTLFHLHLN